MKKTITVKSVEFLKSGERQNGKGVWKLFKIVDENNQKYSCFDETVMEKIGQSWLVDIFEETKVSASGRDFVSRKITAFVSQEQKSGSDRLDALEARVKALEEKMNAKADEISADDLPF